LAAGPVSAQSIHPLGDQLPTGFNTNPYDGRQRGWSFTVGADNLQVDELGINIPTAGTYSIGLWDVATQTLLARTTQTITQVGTWNWFALTSPVPLTNNSSYVVTGVGEGAGTQYYYLSNPGSNWFPSGDIAFGSIVYCNFCTSMTFPDSVLSGWQYGLVDIGYSVASTAPVPEPSGVVMSLAGLGILALALRRRIR
jgi:hypothetical protein